MVGFSSVTPPCGFSNSPTSTFKAFRSGAEKSFLCEKLRKERKIVPGVRKLLCVMRYRPDRVASCPL